MHGNANAHAFCCCYRGDGQNGLTLKSKEQFFSGQTFKNLLLESIKEEYGGPV